MGWSGAATSHDSVEVVACNTRNRFHHFFARYAEDVLATDDA